MEERRAERLTLVIHVGEFIGGTEYLIVIKPAIQLSAQPSAEATGKVEAHLIPSLNVGIDAFAGATKAEVFVNLDASASMTLTVDATLPSVHANVTGREEKSAIEIVRPTVRGRGAIGAYYLKKRSPVPEPFGFGDIVSGIKDGAKKAAGAVTSGAKKAAGAVKSGATKAAGAVKSGAKKVESGAAKAVGSGEKAVENGAKKVTGAVEGGAKKVEEGAKKAGEVVKDGAQKVGGAIAAGAKDVKNAVDPPKSSSSSTHKTAARSSTSASPKATHDKVSVTVNDQVKFGGCLEMDAGLVANVGADADFFGLFNPSKTIPLFQKQFSLFKVCAI
jgi:hypothetical protein